MRHLLSIERADGSGDSTELDSKTFILHDFLHYSIETIAGLEHSFWGQLAGGKTFADMAAIGTERPVEVMMQDLSCEDATTEAIVGTMTGVIKSSTPPQAIISGLQNLFAAQNRPVPEWITVGFIEQIQEKMRCLLGQWNATSYHGSMELEF